MSSTSFSDYVHFQRLYHSARLRSRPRPVGSFRASVQSIMMKNNAVQDPYPRVLINFIIRIR